MPSAEEFGAWVAGACEAHGLHVTGAPRDPRDRPWGFTTWFDTTGGPVWFKACGAGVHYEVPLVHRLAGLLPDLAARVLGVDAQRGWFLTASAGPTMRSAVEPEDTWLLWEPVLARYAEAQLALAPRAPELVGLGVPERSPTTLPGQLSVLIDQLRAAPVDEGGLTDAEASALGARLPAYTEWCGELAGSGIPDSIQHDDLHTSNICWPGGAADARIIDWGDASVGYPLATMLCTLNSIAFHAGCERDDPRVQRIRDAYLEPFTGSASRASLLQWVDLARRTGAVSRALCYQLAYVGDDGGKEAEDDYPVRGWLLELLDE